MKIAGFIGESFIDYPGKLAAVVFTAGCNYNCPSCHAKKIVEPTQFIEEGKILNYLKTRKNFIKGVVICGGEPTIQSGLEYFLADVRKQIPGLAIKLDTNGSNYVKIGRLIEEKLVDYIAMDVKGPYLLYSKLTGVRVDERDGIMKGLAIVSQFPQHEFRTTVCPVVRENGEISFLSSKEIEETARMIYEYSGGTSDHKYFLQKFVARTSEEMLDEKLAKENLPNDFLETSKEHLETCLKSAIRILPDTKIR